MLTESEPHYRQPLLKTPFHERARELSQLDSFVPWAGYSTVDVFTSVEQEYFAIRNASSLYDLTPMVKYRISGADALRFLNRLVTRDIRKVGPGRVAYAVWCDDAGHLIDDGTVFCIAPNEYRLCTGERQLDWLRASAIGFDVEIREVTEDVAALAVQGPTSAKLLKAVGLAGVERLKPFGHGEFTMPRAAGAGAGAIPMMVSRTGFTGDLGYELWMQPADAEAVWDALMEVGRTRAVRPVGSRALNMVRIEAGFVLPNVDFVSAAHALYLGTERSPLELGLAWLVAPASLLGLPLLPRFVIATLLAFIPIFLANLAFSQRFKDVATSGTAFGMNLLGAILGGALEYSALVVGYRALALLAAALYGLAFLFGRAHLRAGVPGRG